MSSPEFSPDHLVNALGMREVSVEGCDLAMEMDNGPHLVNARGALHGGLVATLIDTVAGCAALAGSTSVQGFATADMTIHYLAPIVTGPARAQATVLRRGGRSVVVRVEVYDVGGGALAAVSTATFVVMRPRSA